MDIGNLAGITTPIVIGYLVKVTGSFYQAVVYLACSALMAIVSYVLIAGPIRRIEVSELRIYKRRRPQKTDV